MSSNEILVTMLVVVRNEAKSVGRTLSSILSQDFDNRKMEIVVVDGMSTDKTRSVIDSTLQDSGVGWRLFDNPKLTLAAGWNIGVKESHGKYLIRVDAHAEIPSNYVTNNIKVMDEIDVACVGGPMETRGEGFWGKIIAGILSSVFGAGLSFRSRDTYCGFTDTVAYGMYKKEVLGRIGPFDERMTRSQDWEMHQKMLRCGERIYCDPRIRSIYYCVSNPVKFIKKSFINGYWVAAIPNKSAFRHLAPFFMVMSIIVLAYLCSLRPGHTWYIYRPLRIYLSLYYLVALFYSLSITANVGFHAMVIAPLLYTALHVGYGLGTLYGLITGLWFRVSRPTGD